MPLWAHPWMNSYFWEWETLSLFQRWGGQLQTIFSALAENHIFPIWQWVCPAERNRANRGLGCPQGLRWCSWRLSCIFLHFIRFLFGRWVFQWCLYCCLSFSTSGAIETILHYKSTVAHRSKERFCPRFFSSDQLFKTTKSISTTTAYIF